ncbi:MAG TPA: hypothetical protein VET85_03845 [Stellaceae bacterium]|nr:hypothetical protein [Stellaceae bacterium]
MTLSAHVTLAGKPEFAVRAKAEPIGFGLAGEGSLECRTGEIGAHVSAIPIRMRIPFLKHHHGEVVVGSIGPFGVRLDPVAVEARAFGVRVDGVLGGEDGIECALEGTVNCRMEIDVTGQVPGKLVKAAIEGIIEG